MKMQRLSVFLFCGVLLAGLVFLDRPARTQASTVQELSPGVYFYEERVRETGYCNTGWVIFDDFVLVLDANFPSAAQELIARIRAQTDKPIRFAFDTHHHGDHAYGNQVWAENGATPVAHEGVIAEMKKYETGYYGNTPGRWEAAGREREDVRNSKLKPPTLLYRDLMIFDDGRHRVELHWFGVAHTHGDGFAWLPKEKILFTGDASVNGPYNYMGDGDSGQWIDTLSKAQQLGARQIAPGHGPLGDGSLLEEQKQFFIALRAEVAKRKTLPPEEVQKQVEAMRAALLKKHARFVSSGQDELIPFESQVAQVYKEMTGREFPKKVALLKAYRAHARFHGAASQ